MVGGRSMDAIDSLAEVKNKQNLGGGEEKVEMQRNLGKLTARERIFKLLDNGSFIEVGALLGENGAGVITGHGTIEGRLVYVYSQDYTVDGGALTIENAGLTGSCVGVISSTLFQNESQTDMANRVYNDSGDITILFYDTATGAALDSTSLVDTGKFRTYITYMTNE